jgi:hypothetical protein
LDMDGRSAAAGQSVRPHGGVPKRRARLKYSWLVCVCLVAGVAFPQVPGAGRPDYKDRSGPTNDWQRVPREPLPRPIDAGGRAVRDSRDAYCDSMIGAASPLDQPPGPTRRGHSSGDRGGSEEVPEPGTLAVLLGTFEDYGTFLSASRRSICTEEHVRVDRVIRAAGPNIAPGRVITVLELGGTVRFSNKVIEHFAGPRSEVLVPGQRYLLYLRYEAERDCYSVAKVWELLDGKATPFASEDIVLARQGLSKYAGMGEEDFLSAVSVVVERSSAIGR